MANENRAPWQMTQAEWMQGRPVGTSPAMHRMHHYRYVEEALSEGRPVPQNVLADYPDLLAGKGV